jgi:hypothetical protein
VLKRRAADSRPSASESHTAMGRPAMTRGVGRPAACAAAARRGTRYSPCVRTSPIHVMVPSARSPASRNINGAKAAR